jgi:hypothetical protein
MIKNFPLPAFMHEKTDKSTLVEMKKHIELLELQELSLNVMNVFNKIPGLKSFYLTAQKEYDDQGHSYLAVSTRQITLEKGSKYDNNDEIYDILWQYFYDLKPQNNEKFFHHLDMKLITQDNVGQLIRNIMGNSVYDKWQAEKNAYTEKIHLENTIHNPHSTVLANKL